MSQVDFHYSVLSTTKSKEVSDFLVKNFFPNEPISRAFGLPTTQIIRWFPSQIHECLKQEASIGAINTKTGELVGVAINIVVEKNLKSLQHETDRTEGATEGRGLLEILDPKTEPVMVEIAKFLGVLNQVPDDKYISGANAKTCFQTFNCIYLAVLPGFGGLGIGKQLIEESEKIARQRPASFCQVDTTSDFSYRIFYKHCGYDVIKEIDLEAHIPNMSKIDNGVHKKGRILLKKLQ